MSWFDKAVDFLSGGLGSKLIDTVSAHYPPELSDAQKAELNLVMQRQADEHERYLNRLLNDAQAEFNSRIKALEGTAAELKTIPVIGPLAVFMRAAQRPVWGFATMYMDFAVFSGSWVLTPGTQSQAFWTINFLVLGFLFGERAVKNAAPFIAQMRGAK